jgi:hypothetical protein
MSRELKNFPQESIVLSNLGRVKIDFQPLDQSPYFCIRMKYSDVDVNRVAYSGSIRFLDYGRGRGYEIGRENPREEISLQNCRQYLVMRKTHDYDAKVSETAFLKLVQELTPCIQEWVDENPGLIRSTRMAVVNNRIYRLEQQRLEAEQIFNKVSGQLTSALDEELTLVAS